MTDSERILEVVARINRAWRERAFEGLGRLFEEDAMTAGPGYQVFARGRAACVDSYREFAENATVIEYAEGQPSVQVFGDAAVCFYSWKMTFAREDGPKTESGFDQFVLSRRDGAWRVAFRLMTFG